jgi:hypothetical protein
VESWVDDISVLIADIHRTRYFVCCSTIDKHEAVTKFYDFPIRAAVKTSNMTLKIDELLKHMKTR